MKAVSIVLALAALSAAISPAMAQPSNPQASGVGTVSGIVIDAETGQALGGATVMIEPSSAGALTGPAAGGPFIQATRGVISDDDGSYAFTELPSGRYRIHISRPGYRSATVGVELEGRADSRVSVGLSVEPVALEAIDVVTDRPQPYARDRALTDQAGDARIAAARARQAQELATDARELTHSDVIEAVTLGETDLFRALQRLPGVTTRDDFTAELWTRGASWDQTRVHFDGLPLFHPVVGVGLLSGVSPDAIGSAVLYPGVQPASIGDGAAAGLQLTSRRGGGDGTLRGSADLSLASARVALDQSVLDGRGAWMLSARRSYLDLLSSGVRQLTGDDDAYIPYSFTDLTGRVDYRFDQDRAVEFSGIWEADGLDGDVPDILQGNRGSWGNVAGRVTYSTRVLGQRARQTIGGGRFRSELVEQESAFDSIYSAPSEDPSNAALSHLKLAGEITPGVTGNNLIPWRLGYDMVHVDAEFEGANPIEYGLVPEPTLPPIARTDQLTYGAIWGERMLQLGDRFAIEAGLRLEAGDDVANGGPIRVAPRVLARWRAGPETSLSAGVGRSYQYAQTPGPIGATILRDFSATQIWLLASDSVPAIQADIATVGVESWIGGSWLGSVNAYVRRANGIALRDPRPGRLVERSLYVIGENFARGVELGVRRLAGRWTTSISYSLAESQNTAEGITFPASTDRRHAFDATLLGRLTDSWRVGIAGTAATGAPYTRRYGPYYSCASSDCLAPVQLEPNAQRSPDYSSLDLLIDWSGAFRGWQVGAYLQLRNVLFHDNAVSYDTTTELCPGVGFTSVCPTEYELVDSFKMGIPTLPVFGVRMIF